MAVVVGPLHSSEARGSVGSLQYNTWRGRSTVRTRSGPAIEDQYTDARVNLRGLTAVATAEWQAMTDAERAAWTIYANEHTNHDWTGSPKRITGYNWFVRINVRRQLAGTGIEIVPPTETVTVMLTELELFIDGPDHYIYWETEGIYDEDETGTEIWLTAAHSPGANPGVKAAKRLDVVPMIASQFYISVTPTLWYTAFLRPILSNGVVGGWARLKFQA